MQRAVLFLLTATFAIGCVPTYSLISPETTRVGAVLVTGSR